MTMDAQLLLTHQVYCWTCQTHKNHSEFHKKHLKFTTYKQYKKQRRRCIDCEKYLAKRRKVRQKTGGECFVCGSSILVNEATVHLFTTSKAIKQPACSERCRNLYNKAVHYVMKLHNVKASEARYIVAEAWFNRRLKQYEKDLRLQKGTFQRNEGTA